MIARVEVINDVKDGLPDDGETFVRQPVEAECRKGKASAMQCIDCPVLTPFAATPLRA